MSSGRRAMSFIRKSLVGGLVILLPLAVIGFFFRWIYGIVTDITSPVATLFISQLGLAAVRGRPDRYRGAGNPSASCSATWSPPAWAAGSGSALRTA